METTINPTMDFALAKEALTHLIEGAKLLGLYADELDKWKNMLTKIPPYEINQDGAVSEWMHPFFEDNYHHRHMSHIYPVFPGAEVTRASDPKLFEAFKVAIEKRLVVGISEQTGWSLAHMACIWVRMHDGDQALECLDLLSRSSLMNNFYTTHNDWRDMGIGVELDWAPFQIDANMGWTNAVQQMLMYSMIGRVKVLPALPSKWTKGSVKGLHARGGVDVSIEWDTGVEITNIDLLSPRDQSLDLDAYGGKHKIKVDLIAHQPLRITIDSAVIRIQEDDVSS
jgi:alpha-L-fucosidase 2